MAPKHILKCLKCEKYTLHAPCLCGGEAVSVKPAKWNPEDKYSKYRLKYKEHLKIN